MAASTTVKSSRAYGALEIRRGLKHYAFGRAFAALSGLATVFLIVRLMPVSDYATYTAASAVAALAAALSVVGLDRVVMRFVPLGRMIANQADLRRFVWRLVGVRLAAIVTVALVITAAESTIAGFLHFEGDARVVYVPMLFYMVGLALSDSLAYMLQSLMCQEGLRRAMSAQWGIRLALVLAAALGGFEAHAWHVLWLWAATELLFVAIMLSELRSMLAVHAPSDTDGGERWAISYAEVRRTAFANYAGSIAALPWQLYTLRVIAASLLPTQELAAYGFFQAVIERLRAYLPAQFLQGMTEPLLSTAMARRKDPAEVSDYFEALLNITAWIVVPALLVVALAGDSMVNFLTGGKYGEYSLVLAILLLQILVGTPVTVLWSALNVTGRSAAIVRSVTMPTLIFYPLLVFAGLHIGALGLAAVATLNVVAIRVIMTRGLEGTGLSIGFGAASLLRVGLCSAVILLPVAFVAWTFRPAEPVHVAAVSIAGAVLYLLLGSRFPPLSATQLATLFRVAPWSTRLFGGAVKSGAHGPSRTHQ